MAFNIRMGVPGMEGKWNDLVDRARRDRLDATEQKFYRKLIKALGYLRENPRHNSLASHEIDVLSRNCGCRVFQSYLENKTPAAGRMFWAYGPDRGDITILGVEPHPEDQKRGAYERVKLAAMPSTTVEPEKRKRK
jgi:hypothetical protein